ncbi:MAG: hypothetical protein C0592_09775 [Marinilabiliales bacterium]|nr:MAG: hypothetical protein C0592_09775 [Marinilabiliales bacterium]
MITILIFILSILTGIAGLVFLILGLAYNKRQRIIGGGVTIALALILFFYSLSQFLGVYFKFVGQVMEKSIQQEQRDRRFNQNEEYIVSESDFSDTIYDSNDDIFILNGLEEVQTSDGYDIIAIYKPEEFKNCIPEEISLENSKQFNFLLSGNCINERPDELEIYNESDIETNSSAFVQIQPYNDGRSEAQYILRKEYCKDESHYILLKYE